MGETTDKKDIYEIRRKNLKELVTSLYDGNVAQLARATHKSGSYYYPLLKGKTPFGERAARSIERALYLPPGALDIPEYASEYVAGRAGHRHDGSGDKTELPPAGHEHEMARHDGRPVTRDGDAGTYGSGIIPILTFSHGEHGDPALPVIIRREWALHHLKFSALGNLRAMVIHGDSMLPTLSEGDVIIIDIGVTRLDADAVYALLYANHFFIRRVRQRVNGDVEIISDNPIYPPEIIRHEDADKLKVVGKAIYAFAGKRL